MKSVNQILSDHSSSTSKITVRTFVADRRRPNETEEDTPSQPYVLIEGDADALRFLAELILAQVGSDYGCNLDIHPNGAGSNHFSGSVMSRLWGFFAQITVRYAAWSRCEVMARGRRRGRGHRDPLPASSTISPSFR